jgi:hypothetical protein
MPGLLFPYGISDAAILFCPQSIFESVNLILPGFPGVHLGAQVQEAEVINYATPKY